MTITLGSTTLCAGSTRSVAGDPVGPDDLRGSLAPGISDRAYIGAPGIKPEKIGNDRRGISFSVTRTYATPAAALAYISGGFFAEDVEGALTLGGSTIMTNAAIRDRRFAHVGCTVIVSYQIEGY